MAGGEAGFHGKKHAWRSGLNSGKLDGQVQPHQPPTQLPTCPECGSQRTWKDGVRCTNRGEVQRYICRACGYRFSENPWSSSDPPEHVQKIHRKPLNSAPALHFNRQVCVTEAEGTKNLAEVESRIEKWAAGATTEVEIKGKLVECAWWMQKEGYPESTIKHRIKVLRQILRGVKDSLDVDAVKSFIGKQKSWSNGYKQNAVYAYTTFLTANGLTWDAPKYERPHSLPFVPLESEIDQLINGCGRKLSIFLEALKETAADPGELLRVEWIDINEQSKTIAINHPVKKHNARIVPVSSKLLERLNLLPRKSKRVFPILQETLYNNFWNQRKRIAINFNNPRLLEVSFTTFRHWKATHEYHRTKDILYVKWLLGHKKLETTMIYIDLEKAIYGEHGEVDFVSKAVTLEKDACELIEAGFDYVCTTPAGVMLFRKRK